MDGEEGRIEMMKQPILSLCLPTNGIIEWVFPVLDSIYAQSVNQSLFEVIVTNNGSNEEFHKMMLEYTEKHTNLIYKKNNTYMFHNQLEALKLASGVYLKFVNHRAIMTDGSIDKLIKIITDNIQEKPVIYFSNGALNKDKYVLSDFNSFVATLGRYASWTTGVGIWEEDYEKIPEDVKIDKISPHSCILFSERKKNKYIIDNFIFSKEIESDHSNKGKYNLFKAFAVEELTITQNLFIDGDITAETFKAVKRDYRNFVAELYLRFCIRKEPCSYDLTGFDDSMGIYFSTSDIIIRAWTIRIKNLFLRIMRGKSK